MKKVILDGPFYGPFASEGRWAWNIAKLLDKLAALGEITLDLYQPFIPHLDCRSEFPNSNIIDASGIQEHYDILFLVQPGADLPNKKQYINDLVKADKRIICIFELYWTGWAMDECNNIPENTIFCYAIYPKHPDHQKWNKKGEIKQLPYSSALEETSYNFSNKGILLTIKFPIHPDFDKATIDARIDHYEIALKFLKQGIPVTIGHLIRDSDFFDSTYIEGRDRFRSITNELGSNGARCIGKVLPEVLRQEIRNHSVVFTGKVGTSGLYASFYDVLNHGSIPIIWNDWPEQFFDSNTFEPYSKLQLEERTKLLLNDRSFYKTYQSYLRNRIGLFTEEQGLDIVRDLL